MTLGKYENEESEVIGDEYRPDEAQILTEKESGAAHGLGNHGQDRLVFDLPAERTRGAENAEEQTAHQ